MPSPSLPLLMISESMHDADMYYASGFCAPDPFIFLKTARSTLIAINSLEFGRARKESRVDAVVMIDAYHKRAVKRFGKKLVFADGVCELLKAKKITAVRVPRHFHIGHAEALRKRKIRVQVARGPVFPERAVKTPQEIKVITRTVRITENVLLNAIDIIRHARVRKSLLYHQGHVLTSEIMRTKIHTMLLEHDCVAQATIIACGRQAADPHCIGQGPLRANQSIVIDVFPRSQKTRYYADLTRTVVKGTASDRLKNMYTAVKTAQEQAINNIKPGVSAHSLWQDTVDYFERHHFPTRQKTSHVEGFFHGLGHGVGLDIHEQPGCGREGGPLQAGQVITVEPGLYYPRYGGVRLEDMVLVSPGGARRLSDLPYILEV